MRGLGKTSQKCRPSPCHGHPFLSYMRLQAFAWIFGKGAEHIHSITVACGALTPEAGTQSALLPPLP